MAGFALAYVTGSLLLGFALAMVVGALIALLVASSSIYLKQDQVAIGFVLTLLMAEVSSFVGRPSCAFRAQRAVLATARPVDHPDHRPRVL